MKYHPHQSPRSLTTVTDHLRGYPAYWELMKWYLCWRKVPYPTEVIAALVVEDRPEEYSHYPCPMHPDHWHIGRGGGNTDPKRRFQQAKRTYRKAVRDEIWRNHVVRQDEERARERRDATALVD
jgi:hypothetical protein